MILIADALGWIISRQWSDGVLSIKKDQNAESYFPDFASKCGCVVRNHWMLLYQYSGVIQLSEMLLKAAECFRWALCSHSPCSLSNWSWGLCFMLVCALWFVLCRSDLSLLVSIPLVILYLATSKVEQERVAIYSLLEEFAQRCILSGKFEQVRFMGLCSRLKRGFNIQLHSWTTPTKIRDLYLSVRAVHNTWYVKSWILIWATLIRSFLFLASRLTVGCAQRVRTKKASCSVSR